MGILSTVTSWFSNQTLWTPDWIAAAGGDPRSTTMAVNPASAVGLSAVYRAISVYVDNMASMNVQLTRKHPTGGIEVIQNGVSGKLSLWTFEDKELSFNDCLLYGNWYVTADSLTPIPNHRMTVEVSDTGEILYHDMGDISLGIPEKTYPKSDIIHLKYRSTGRHNVLGVSPLQSAAPAISLSMVITETARSLYRNQSLPGVTLNTGKDLNRDQVKELKERWNSQSTGLNKGGAVILASGLTATPYDIRRATDLDLNNLMKISVAEVSRTYGVPLHLLSVSDDVNYSTASEMWRSFVMLSLQPLVERMGDSLTRTLLTPQQIKDGFRVSFDISGQLSGQGTEKADYLRKMVNSGVMALNEARNLSGLPDVEHGDAVRAPLNTASLDNWIDFRPNNSEPEERSAKIQAFKDALAADIKSKPI